MSSVLYDKDAQGIVRLTLNRPEKLNAVDLAMRDELWSAFEAFRDDPDARVLILRGVGDAFSAGADISDFGTAPSYVEARRARHERGSVHRIGMLHAAQPSVMSTNIAMTSAGDPNITASVSRLLRSTSRLRRASTRHCRSGPADRRDTVPSGGHATARWSARR